MKHLLFIIVVVVLILSACDSNKTSVGPRVDDSVMSIVKANRELIASIQEANALLDSIYHITKDSSGKREHENNSTALISNLKQLQEDVIVRERKLAKIEKALRVSRNEADAYLLMVLAYKNEVQLRDDELQMLSDSLVRFNSTSDRIVSAKGI